MKYLLAILFCALTASAQLSLQLGSGPVQFAVTTATNNVWQLSGPTNSSAPSLTCQAYFDVTSGAYVANNNPGSSVVSQKIQGSASGVTVCSVTVIIGNYGTKYCELWSNGDGTGTQYGATSLGTATPSLGAYTFTWATNPTVPANTDFYVCWRSVDVYQCHAAGSHTAYNCPIGDVQNSWAIPTQLYVTVDSMQ